MNKMCVAKNGIIHYSPYRSDKGRKLYLELTSKCNLHCKHCFNNSGDNDDYLSIEKVRQIINHIISKNVEVDEIILSGGEPLIHPDFEQILLLLNNYDVKILTNGTLINENSIQLFLNNNCKIQVTLNGSNQKIDSELRGAGSFEKTFYQLQKMIDAGLQDKLIVTTTLNKTNMFDLENIIKLLISIGIKNHQITFVYKVGRADQNWQDVKLENYSMLVLIEEIANLKQKYSNKIRILTSGTKQFLHFLTPEIQYSCSELNEEISINSQGYISICPKIKEYLQCHNQTNCDYYFTEKELQIAMYDNRRCPVCSKRERWCLLNCLP